MGGLEEDGLLPNLAPDPGETAEQKSVITKIESVYVHQSQLPLLSYGLITDPLFKLLKNTSCYPNPITLNASDLLCQGKCIRVAPSQEWISYESIPQLG